MLIDDLVVGGAPGSGCDVSCLLPAARASHKYALSPEFAAVADALSTDFTGLVKAFPFCRIPFKRTWVEVVHTDRPRFAAAGIQVPQFQRQPHRVGYLLTATRDDLSAWRTHLFWSIEGVGVSAPPLAMDLDMARPIGTPITRVPTEAEFIASKQASAILRDSSLCAHPGWDAASDEVRLAMMNHCDPVIADYGAPPLPAGIHPSRATEFLTQIMDLARSDWAGEPSFLLAVIGLLNARNAVATTDVDMSLLNRARLKRGRGPLFSYKVLKIADRQLDRVYGAGPRGDREPMRGHFVRGHFKVRRTGIFFWTPHARGVFAKTKELDVTAHAHLDKQAFLALKAIMVRLNDDRPIPREERRAIAETLYAILDGSMPLRSDRDVAGGFGPRTEGRWK